MKVKIIFPALFILMIVTSIALIKNKHNAPNDFFTQNLEALTNGEHGQDLVSCKLKIEWVKGQPSYDVIYCTGCYSVPVTSSSEPAQCIR